MELLLAGGADVSIPDRDGKAALHHAARCPQYEGALSVSKLLVRAGADIAVLDNEGQTAMEIAASFNHKDLVRFLTRLDIWKW